MTPWERKLWYDFLCRYPVRFQRQKPIDNYIVDFYCAKAKLVIELDGSQHRTDDGKEKDMIRDKYMNGLGLLVLRIKNRAIDNEFESVCGYIDKTIRERIENDKL